MAAFLTEVIKDKTVQRRPSNTSHCSRERRFKLCINNAKKAILKARNWWTCDVSINLTCNSHAEEQALMFLPECAVARINFYLFLKCINHGHIHTLMYTAKFEQKFLF